MKLILFSYNYSHFMDIFDLFSYKSHITIKIEFLQDFNIPTWHSTLYLFIFINLNIHFWHDARELLILVLIFPSQDAITIFTWVKVKKTHDFPWNLIFSVLPSQKYFEHFTGSHCQIVTRKLKFKERKGKKFALK